VNTSRFAFFARFFSAFDGLRCVRWNVTPPLAWRSA
jgi:hypothetical protein